MAASCKPKRRNNKNMLLLSLMIIFSSAITHITAHFPDQQIPPEQFVSYASYANQHQQDRGRFGSGIDNLCPGDRPVLYQLLKSNVPHSSFVPSAVSQTTRAPYQQTIVSAIPVHSSRLPANGGISGPIPVAGVYPPVVYPPPVVHVRDPPRNSAIYTVPPPRPVYSPGAPVSHARDPRSTIYPVPPPFYPYPAYPYYNPSYPPPPPPPPPAGAYPGGLYPGGPGYGNGGSPYGYPGVVIVEGDNKGGGKGNYKKVNNTVTMYNTVTLNGLITTLTISGVEGTVIVEYVPSVVTLPPIVSTVFLPGAGAPLSETIVDGQTVTVTVPGVFSTVTLAPLVNLLL